MWERKQKWVYRPISLFKLDISRKRIINSLLSWLHFFRYHPKISLRFVWKLSHHPMIILAKAHLNHLSNLAPLLWLKCHFAASLFHHPTATFVKTLPVVPLGRISDWLLLLWSYIHSLSLELYFLFVSCTNHGWLHFSLHKFCRWTC